MAKRHRREVRPAKRVSFTGSTTLIVTDRIASMPSKKAKGINPGLPEAEASADKYAGALKKRSNKSKPSILTITMKIIRTTGFSGARKRILLCWQPSEILSRRTRVFDAQVDKLEDQVAQKTWKSLRTIRRKNMITP